MCIALYSIRLCLLFFLDYVSFTCNFKMEILFIYCIFILLSTSLQVCFDGPLGCFGKVKAFTER